MKDWIKSHWITFIGILFLIVGWIIGLIGVFCVTPNTPAFEYMMNSCAFCITTSVITIIGGTINWLVEEME